MWLAGLKLQDVRPDHIDRLMLEQRSGGRRDGRDGGVSDRTIQATYILLNDAFTMAVKRKRVTSNPCAAMDKPQWKPAPSVAWTAPQLGEFLATLDPEDDWDLRWWMYARTGARKGELIPLRWGDVDTKNGTITITGGVVQVGYEAVLKTHPKSEAGNRTIPLDDPELLAALRKRVGHPRAFVFAEPDGSFTHPDRVSKLFDKRVAAFVETSKTHAPMISLKGLRKSFGSIMAEAGVPSVTLMKLMGHESIATTEKFYVRRSDGADRSAAETFSAALSGRARYGVDAVKEGGS